MTARPLIALGFLSEESDSNSRFSFFPLRRSAQCSLQIKLNSPRCIPWRFLTSFSLLRCLLPSRSLFVKPPCDVVRDPLLFCGEGASPSGNVYLSSFTFIPKIGYLLSLPRVFLSCNVWEPPFSSVRTHPDAQCRGPFFRMPPFHLQVKSFGFLILVILWFHRRGGAVVDPAASFSFLFILCCCWCSERPPLRRAGFPAKTVPVYHSYVWECPGTSLDPPRHCDPSRAFFAPSHGVLRRP